MTIPSTRAGTQESRGTLKSTAPFGRVADYVYENADETATVSYLPPSVVFAPYRHLEIQAVSRELRGIFRAIVDHGVAVR